ncbi:putative gmc oxidoreductase protein [Lasiodiplodia theobromae]|uniref:Cellobiose dehydrogenase n=1 Tax=Lasiodiplodia theobromae TaxID=45133 RepID=A0A5N5D710_9PEZI|nr:Cellobiose dehydrogenase [Lasiodiplodia theobromae]KAF9634048.1 putative gmc oxidoreductase protein [Lasiodiplodia theobromae]
MRSTAAISLFAAGALAANTTYDYIVVGGGPAGIIAAERFAETGASVLLLERGGPSAYSSGNNNTLPWNNTVTSVDIPAYGYLARSTLPAGTFCTDTASNAGCILGGGGTVNAEMFVPPHADDFATWPRGWRWEDGVAEAAAAVHERNPGSVSPSQDGRHYLTGVFDLFGGFLGENGWKQVDAVAQPDEKHNVYGYPPFNVQNAVRAGPVRTYLPLAEALPNFTLKLHTKVIRVVRTGSTATGVEVEDASGARSIINLTSSTGKVVLAAGVMTTPRLLFNSGIGPASQIELVANGSTTADSVSLPPRADWIELPVGEGVKDHPIFYINLNLTAAAAGNDSSVVTLYDPQNPPATDIALYNSAGAGPLAQGVQRLIFWTSRTNSSTARERFFQGTVTLDAPSVISVKTYLTRGLTSSGVLGVNATDPTKTVFTVKPWLSDLADKDAVVSLLDELLALFRTKGDGFWTPVDWMSGQEIVEASELLQSYTAGAHFVGTTQLGTVVESGERGPLVKGTSNVYVVDAGIHTDVPTGNTNAMVMVVAEHAAKKIVDAAARK